MLRVKLGMTQEAFADHMGYARNYISMLERGTKKPGKRFLKQLELMERGTLTSEHEPYPQRAEAVVLAGEKMLPFQTAPLISWASAGDSRAYEDQGYNVPRVPTTCRDPNAYCLEIEGDSMEPKYTRGDIVVVAPGREPRNGEVVIARTKTGETYFKVYHWSGNPRDPVKLSSFNPAYPVLEIKRGELRIIQPVHSVLRLLRKD